MIVIGFGYKKSSGKSTLAKFLSTHINCTHPKLRVTEVSFASKLKDISFQLYGWAGLKRAIYYETHYTDKEIILPLIGMSPREIWIGIGNSLRAVYSNTWIDYALKSIKSDIIIISDMGFTNEARAIRTKGGKLIKLIRDNQPKGTDPREVELDSWADWDLVINNNGSLDDLYKHAIRIWENFNDTK